MEGPEDGHIQPIKDLLKEEEKPAQREEEDSRTSGPAEKPQEPAEGRRAEPLHLTKKDLLHLLGVMEGEVQVGRPPGEGLEVLLGVVMEALHLLSL